jgi:NADH-quinone oxidoreductase subunit L
VLDLLWLVPALPFAGYLTLAMVGSRLGKGAAAVVGAGSVGAAAAVAAGITLTWLSSPPPEGGLTQTLWQWFSVAGFDPAVAFRLDPLSIVMMLVVTGVGFLIHVYSAEYMDGDDGFARFFAYMNLFVGMMLVLVLADDLLLLYLGWEGVGLCSFLLIGFWYKDPANGAAARKAFVVTRVGDVAMAVALFLLVERFGTLRVTELLERAPAAWAVGSPIALVVAACLLGGAVGKSAQLPLQTWLPDAMAGPTPVSALIHAATMVTAGVYLIARTHTLFEIAPPVMTAVAVVGAATLLLAGFSALCQRDIKRVLAYSTISQIGYMFLALGVGAWSAAVFHLMTHAFFKALLFMAAGAVILALHHEQDLAKMGGLRKRLPAVFWTFLIGGGALAGVPLVTAGFYSKDLILWEAWSSAHGSRWLWAAGLAGAFLTSLYVFRLIFLAFFGEERTHVHRKPGPVVTVPLLILAALSLAGGFVEVPASIGGGLHAFTDFLDPALPPATGAAHAPETMHAPEPALASGPAHAAAGHAAAGHDTATEAALQGVAALAVLLGFGLAWAWFHRRRAAAEDALRVPVIPRPLSGFWLRGWDFDALYDALFVRPVVWIARVNRADVLDLPYAAAAALARGGHGILRRLQTGRLRWYAAGLGFGAVALVAMAVWR